MPFQTSGSNTTTGSVTLTKPQAEGLVGCALSGDYTGLSFVFEGSYDGNNWFPVAAQSAADASVVSGTVSPSDASVNAWKVPAEFLAGVRARVTAISANTATFVLASGVFSVPSVSTVCQTGQTVSNSLTLADGANLAAGTTTGTKLGTATSQKLGLFNATPIVQPANTVDVFTGLVNLGLRASGGTAATTLPGLVSGLYTVFSGVASPAAFAASADDLAIGAVGVVRVTTDGNGGQNLTGMVKTTNGQLVLIQNVGTTDSVTIKHSATSSAANQFICPNSADVTLRKNGSVYAWYDATSTKWRVMGA
jgi:hypothetical protein